MALLSYPLIEKILDVAETYAKQEKQRLSQLDQDGKPKLKAGHEPARTKPSLRGG